MCASKFWSQVHVCSHCCRSIHLHMHVEHAIICCCIMQDQNLLCTHAHLPSQHESTLQDKNLVYAAAIPFSMYCMGGGGLDSGNLVTL